MTITEIMETLGAHLAAMAGCPELVWPNKTTIPALPYATVALTGLNTTDQTLAGSSEVTTGRLVVVAVYPLNSYATLAQEMAETIKARFPRGPLGALTIRQAQVLDGYPTDTDFRVPVAIDWIA